VIRFLLWIVVSGAAFAQTSKPPLPTPEEASRAADQPALETISPEQYRDRLISMQRVVATCREAISANHCASEAVGGDVRISLNSGARTVRFGWLRTLLEEAGHYDPAKDQPAAPKSNLPTPLPGHGSSPTGPANASPANEPLDGTKLPPAAPHDELEDADAAASIPARLEQAKDRLADDLNRLAEATAAKPASPAPAATERKALTAILAGNEFHAATVGRTLKDRVLEKIASWINRAINKLVSVGAKSKGIGVTAEIGFVLALCVGLVWFLIRLEKQGRFGSVHFQARAANGAPSERDWQLWLKDARLAAGSGEWREAIHFLYWASISRMESGGLWSADRARTPREYLALLSEATTQRAELKSGLTALTRSFERTWYGGRPAVEADFQLAEQLAAALGAKSDASTEWRKGSQ
jgi:hypothetical protein